MPRTSQDAALELAWWSEALLGQVQGLLEEQTQQLQSSVEEQTRQLQGLFEEVVRRGAEGQTRQLQSSFDDVVPMGAEQTQQALTNHLGKQRAQRLDAGPQPSRAPHRRPAPTRARAADEADASAAEPLLDPPPGRSAHRAAVPTAEAPRLQTRRSSIELRRQETERFGDRLLRAEDRKSHFVEALEHLAAPEMGTCVSSFARRVEAFWSIEEPLRAGKLALFVGGTSFQTFFTCVIAANVTYMVISVNREAAELHEELAAGKLSNPVAEHTRLMPTGDICFLCLFCIELCCKLAVHRAYFFWNHDMGWNWMDFLLVCYSMVDVFSKCASEDPSRGATWIRTLRVFRVAKVLRILRLVQAFKQIQVIMSAVLESMLSLFWILMVFALIFILFSLYFVSATTAYLENGGSDEDGELLHQFGSVQRCVVVLFKTLTGGDDWGRFHKDLLPVGLASTVFIFYVCVSQLALINIVTGIFVDNALKLSEPEVEQKAADKYRQDKELARALMKHLLKDDGNSRLSKAKFRDILGSGKLETFLRYLEIDPVWSKKNLPVIFDRVVEQSEEYKRGDIPDDAEVEIHSFVEMCMHMRGNARSTEMSDLHEVMLQVQTTQDNMLKQLGPNSMPTQEEP